jgi:cytochrome b
MVRVWDLFVRVAWGFIGTRHARFSDFVYTPATVIACLRDLVLFRSSRHLGHGPAGGVMVLALLAVLAATVATGLAAYGAEGRGQLASWFPAPVAVEDAGPEGEDDDDEREGEGEGGVFTEVREALGDIALLLVLAHIGGVALASLAHRENLPRTMVTGDKRAP